MALFTSLNASSASLAGFLSGCTLTHSLRYARFRSSSVAWRVTPSRWYRSRFLMMALRPGGGGYSAAVPLLRGVRVPRSLDLVRRGGSTSSAVRRGRRRPL